MSILLAYATYSGSTQAAAQIIEEALKEKGHAPTIKQAAEITEQDIVSSDLVVFASPSWDFEGHEGMPHEDFIALQKKLEGKTFPSKKFAVLGLGDSSYTHFCGAVDHLEEYIQSWQGDLAAASLRIDGYYYKAENPSIVKTWAQKLV